MKDVELIVVLVGFQYLSFLFGILVMDLFNDIFSIFNLKGILYFCIEFSGKWVVMVLIFVDVVRFYLVIKGCCYVRIDDD